MPTKKVRMKGPFTPRGKLEGGIFDQQKRLHEAKRRRGATDLQGTAEAE